MARKWSAHLQTSITVINFVVFVFDAIHSGQCLNGLVRPSFNTAVVLLVQDLATSLQELPAWDTHRQDMASKMQITRLRSLVHDCLAKHLYDGAIFFADKLVTRSAGDPQDVYLLAQVTSHFAYPIQWPTYRCPGSFGLWQTHGTSQQQEQEAPPALRHERSGSTMIVP
jgi:hypothetical protein